jgi:hypothetical protein
MPERIGRLVALVLVCAAALAGCATIPDSGPVRGGGGLGVDPDAVLVPQFADPPAPGQSPDRIVLGFLRAASGYLDEHQTARKYLMPSRGATWSSDSSVTLYRGEDDLRVRLESLDGKPPPADAGRTATATATATAAPTPAAGAPAPPSPGAAGATTRNPLEDAQTAVVLVDVPVLATIDQVGVYTAVPGALTTLRFGLARSAGQWRIQTLSNGVLLTESDFRATFNDFAIYFPDPTGRYLVPDVRWLPPTTTRATLLAQAVLDGPSDWLAGAVHTGAPRGTSLSVGAVVVENRIAAVDLTEEALGADARQRALLLGQLTATLTVLPTIDSVRITVGQVAYDDLPPPPATGSRPADPAPAMRVDPQVDPRPLVLDAKGRVGYLEGDTAVPVEGLAGLTVPGGSHPAAAADKSAYAILAADRTRLLYQAPGANGATQLLTGTRLTPPSIDPRGWVWSTSGTPGESVTAGQGPDKVVRVGAPWLAGYEVRVLRVSRDGTRVLIVAAKGGTSTVLVSGIVRTAAGEPLALGKPVTVAPDLTTVRDAAWASGTEIAILGRRPGDNTRLVPAVAEVGGATTSPLPPWDGSQTPALASPSASVSATAKPDPRADAARAATVNAITAGNGRFDLYLGTSSGLLLRRIGADWLVAASGVSGPTFGG